MSYHIFYCEGDQYRDHQNLENSHRAPERGSRDKGFYENCLGICLSSANSIFVMSKMNSQKMNVKGMLVSALQFAHLNAAHL